MRLFEKMKILDVVSWTTLITTYVHKGEEEHALEAFKRMRIVFSSDNELSLSDFPLRERQTQKGGKCSFVFTSKLTSVFL